MNNSFVYTVGHSTHQLDYFLQLLQDYNIDCVIDVRSVAASTYNPQYNQAPFARFLSNNKITYLHFAKEFGARQIDPALKNKEGKVDFEKVRNSINFRNGVERLRSQTNKGLTVALMCSESDPFDCHRFSMISVALKNDGFDVRHILKDRSLKSNAELEKQLLLKYEKKLPTPDLFNPHISLDDQLCEAYRLKNKEIGFSPDKKEFVEDYD